MFQTIPAMHAPEGTAEHLDVPRSLAREGLVRDRRNLLVIHDRIGTGVPLHTSRLHLTSLLERFRWGEIDRMIEYLVVDPAMLVVECPGWLTHICDI